MDRNEQKRLMIWRRSGIATLRPACDYCRKREGTQMHELIARNKTVGNEEARELSYQKELCSLLCAECHQIADYTKVDEALWKFNILLWGRTNVLNALNALNAVMRVGRFRINE